MWISLVPSFKASWKILSTSSTILMFPLWIGAVFVLGFVTIFEFAISQIFDDEILSRLEKVVTVKITFFFVKFFIFDAKLILLGSAITNFKVPPSKAQGTIFSFFINSNGSIFRTSGLICSGFISFILIFIIYITKENQTKYFSSFWVESVPIYWLIIQFILFNRVV